MKHMLMSLVTMLTMMSMVSAYGAVQDQRCEDCITVVAGLQDASLSNERFDVALNMTLIHEMMMQFDDANGNDSAEHMS